MSEVHEAAAAGDSEQILNLLNLGKYDVNQKDAEWHDRTPLHWAAIKGNFAKRCSFDHSGITQ